MESTVSVSFRSTWILGFHRDQCLDRCICLRVNWIKFCQFFFIWFFDTVLRSLYEKTKFDSWNIETTSFILNIVNANTVYLVWGLWTILYTSISHISEIFENRFHWLSNIIISFLRNWAFVNLKKLIENFKKWNIYTK